MPITSLGEVKSQTPIPHVQQAVARLLTHNPMVNAYSLRKPNLYSTANKRLLPSSSRRLTHINLGNTTRLRDAPSMARALQEAWEPIWAKPHPQPKATALYLRNYNQRIGTPPFRGLP